MSSSPTVQSHLDFENSHLNSNEFYKQIIESLEDYALFTMNDHLQITTWNAGAKNLFDYSEDEIIGKHVLMLSTDEDIKNSVPQKEKDKALLFGRAEDERYHVRKDGSKFWASGLVFPLKDGEGKPKGFTKIMRNINAKKEAEQRLFEAKHFAENIIETADNLLVILDGDLKLHSASHSFFDFFAIEPLGAAGRDIFSIWGNAQLEELLIHIMPHQDVCDALEITDHFVQFGRITLSVKARKIFWFKDYPEMIILSMKDITNLAPTIKQKDDFISVASHELKTPVTVIKLYTQILEKLTVAEAHSALRKPIFKIQEQADKLSQLLSTLLDLSQLQAGNLKLKFEHFELSEVVEKTLEDFRLILQTHQLIFTNKVSGFVYADKIRLAQVLVNFIMNAVKYSPSNDTIFIDMYKSADEDELMITIRDLSTCIADEAKNSKFKKLSCIEKVKDNNIQGAGLGLRIASEIVHKHGGEIGFENEENMGTEFFFKIPIYKQNN